MAETFMQLYEEKQQNFSCDVTFVAVDDGKRIPAHRCVLQTASEYFRALFAVEMKEKSLDEIPLEGISGNILGQLIDYAYTHKIEIDASNVDDLLAAADRFLFDSAIAMCEIFYANEIKTANAFHILAIAEQYRLNELQVAARTFTYERCWDIIESEAFLDEEVGTVIEYFRSDDIKIKSERDVFNAIVKWIKVDLEQRKQHYGALMRTLRMTRIDSKFLYSRIKEWSVFLNMRCVYMEAWRAKYRRNEMEPDGERSPLFKSLFFGSSISREHDFQIERYSLESNKWENFTLIQHSSFRNIYCIDDCLYLVGPNKMICMSLDSMLMECRKPLGKFYCSSVADAHYIYFLGTWPYSDDYCVVLRDICSYSRREVVRYDTRSDSWVDMTLFNQPPMLNQISVVLAGKIYIIGDADWRTVQRYDPESNLWTKVADLNIQSYWSRCCVTKGSIYIVGIDYERTHLVIERYDEQLDQWTMIEHKFDSTRSPFEITASGDWIYIIEVTSLNDMTRFVRRINISDGRSEKLATTNNKFHSCISCVLTHY